MLFPVSTMALDVLLTRGQVDARTLAGAALVMAGVWAGALRHGGPPAILRTVRENAQVTAPAPTMGG